MKKWGILFSLILSGLSSTSYAENAPWTEDQARLLPSHRWEGGIFSPLRYGINDSLELETRPLAFFIIPNLAAKIKLEKQGSWSIASKHSLHIPTFLLRSLSGEGSAKLLPLNSKIPFMLSIGTGIVGTTQIASSPHFLSVESGFLITPRFGDADFPELELPFLYLRTASYHVPVSVKGSLTLEGRLVYDFYYSLQQTGMLAPGYGNGAFALEHSGKVMWRPHENFELMAGVIATLNRYPRQTRLNLFPLFDIRFAF